MKNGIVHRLGRAPEAAAWNGAGCGCDWVMEIKRTQGVVIGPDWGYNSPFGVHITNCKRFNLDHVIFAMHVKCLANSAEQRKRDKLADIY